VRAPAGTRIEKTEQLFQAIEDKIREVIPDSEREQILDNIGLPARNNNLAFADGTTIGVKASISATRSTSEGSPTVQAGAP
jgi:hypothetical protein